MKYKLIVDYGKPFEIVCLNKEALFNELLKIEQSYYNNEDEESQIDIYILKKNKNITEEAFKEYNLKKEKVGFLIWVNI